MSPFVEGVRDLLPGEIQERKWIYQKLRKIFSKNGYQEVATPTLESLDLYAGMKEILAKEEMFKVVDERGKILVLRPDVTMPITRLAAASYTKIPKPWKFSYITTAYQFNRSLADHMKEKTQAGIELMGRDDLQADVEVIGILIRALQKIGIKNPQIDLGQAALVEEIFLNLNLDESTKYTLRQLMEEKNVEEIRIRLQDWNLTEDEQKLLLEFPTIFGEPEEVVYNLRKLPLTKKALDVVDRMEELFFYFKGIGLAEYITFDPMMITHLGYYTGFIFRAYVSGYGEVIASGGRYDRLASKFGLDIPAVGFAIEIERLMNCLQKFHFHKVVKKPAILLKVKNKDEFVRSYQLADYLKEKDLVVEICKDEEFDEYCEYHQIPYMGEWNEDRFILHNQNGYKIKFDGDLKVISQKCLNYCLGGQK